VHSSASISTAKRGVTKKATWKIQLVLVCFLVLLILRTLNGLFFLYYISVAESIALESIISFWLPYFVMNIEFSAITIIILLWLSILRNATLGKTWNPFAVKIVLLVTNIILWLGTLLSLASIRPFGDSEFLVPELYDEFLQEDGAGRIVIFRWVYFALGILCLIVMIVSFIVIHIKLTELMQGSVEAVEVKKGKDFKEAFRKKTQTFIIANVIIFLFKIILDWSLIFFTVNELLRRTMEFAWHTVPELVVVSVFLWMVWKTTADVVASDPTAATRQKVEKKSTAAATTENASTM